MENSTSPAAPAGFLRNWPVLAVFVAGLVVTLFSLFLYQQNRRQDTIELAGQDAAEYQRLLQRGGDSYVHLNRDVAGLFAAADDVTPREFAVYVRSVHAFDTHPGLGYIGYVPRVPNMSPVPNESAAAADPNFAYPLLYRVSERNGATQLGGPDFSSIPERWEAMQQARDLGKSIATARHGSADAADAADARNAVVIVTPVYGPARTVDTVEQRRAALTGFVVSSFVADEVVERVMGSKFKDLFDLEIYDGTVDRAHVLYDGDNQPHVLVADDYPVALQETVDFAERSWLLYFYPKPAYFKKYDSRHDWLLLLSGALLSALLAFLTSSWQHRRHAKRLQHEYAQRFHAVFEHHPAAVFALDPQWRFINANTKALEEFEIGADQLIGSSAERRVAPEAVAPARALFARALQGETVTYDSTIVTGQGKQLDVSVVLIPVTADGKVSSVLGIAQNITERKRAEWRLQESRQMLQLVIDNIPQRVFWKDTELLYLGCNKAFCEDAGVAHPEETIGKTDHDFPWKAYADAYRQDDRATMESGAAKINDEKPYRRTDGSEYWLRTSKIPLRNNDGQVIGILGVYEDISERKQLEQKLKKMAHYDTLTGLPSRAYFYDRLGQAIKRSKRNGSLLGLMYFDIDRFKFINDSYGHDAGDAVIAQFAQRLKDTVREIDIVGRLGGDEFCLVVEDLASRDAATALARKLIEAMQPAMRLDTLTLQISTSIGIAFHAPGLSADELVRRADQAMYRAKQAGRNRFEIDD